MSVKCRACIQFHPGCICNKCQMENLMATPACCYQHDFCCPAGPECPDFVPETPSEAVRNAPDDASGCTGQETGNPQSAGQPGALRTEGGG